MGTGFANAFNQGEISEEAWDRTDIQPINKGCEEAINCMIRVAGPLVKRRGFWNNGEVAFPDRKSRLVPFRRSVDDALMLEFADQLVRLWNSDGSPYLFGGAQVTFASPYTENMLDGLRWKQVNDVIYLRHRDGLPPQTLERFSNITWVFTVEFFPNGPWRPENTDLTTTITVTGTDESDANADTGAGSIAAGQTVDLLSNNDVFVQGHVNSKFRFRQTDGMPGVKAWSAGNRPDVGTYCVSAGRTYRSTHKGAFDNNVTNPPVNESGSQNDGGNTWEYRHDGAGIVKITAVTDATHAQGIVRFTLPFKSGVPTNYFSENAWSDFRGFPRMWPSVREERLVEGATASNPDYVDLTMTGGFTPISETLRPGLGSGQVLATDGVRRRVGDDGAELVWSIVSTFLVVGSTSGEYIVAGPALEEGITPQNVIVKQIGDFGSADHLPARAHKGIIFITRGGETLRELVVAPDQSVSTDDLTVLASHIGSRGLAQLAWTPQPDDTLWVRLADGGLAALVYHKEQQVRDFVRCELPGGFLVEDMAVLPGPGRLETLWLIVSRQNQRLIWMLSRKADGLFMDCAELYEGPPAKTITGLDALDGETVLALADGEQVENLVVSGGAVTLPKAARRVLVGLRRTSRFKSLRIDSSLGGSLGRRQRITEVIVSLKTAKASVGVDGVDGEVVFDRRPGDVPAPVSRRLTHNVTLLGDTDEDPRIVVEDDTAYDFALYSLKPKVAVGE